MWFVKNKTRSGNLEYNYSLRVVFTHFICFTFWVYTYILVHIILSNKQNGQIKKIYKRACSLLSCHLVS